MQIWEVGYKYEPDIVILESKTYSDGDEAFKALNFIREKISKLPDREDYDCFVKVSRINNKFDKAQWLFDLIPGEEQVANLSNFEE
jgi:hypothetical protein